MDKEETKKEVIEHLNQEMPFCNKGNCVNNWEFNCINENQELRNYRVLSRDCCPFFKVGEHEFYLLSEQ